MIMRKVAGGVRLHLSLSEIKNKTFLTKVCGSRFADNMLCEAIDVIVTQVNARQLSFSFTAQTNDGKKKLPCFCLTSSRGRKQVLELKQNRAKNFSLSQTQRSEVFPDKYR